MDTAQTAAPRQLTPAELAVLVKLNRDYRKWSQEQLAEIAGLSPRTVQRVEDGQPSSVDTRRALASAFDVEDVDAFNKAYSFPTLEQIAAEKERFDKERVTLKAEPMTTGRQLGRLVEQANAYLFTEGEDLPPDASEVFAQITDFCTEYADFDELYSATGKLEVYAQLDDMLQELKNTGFTLVAALRKTELIFARAGRGVPGTIIYVAAFADGRDVETLAVPREARMG